MKVSEVLRELSKRDSREVSKHCWKMVLTDQPSTGSDEPRRDDMLTGKYQEEFNRILTFLSWFPFQSKSAILHLLLINFTLLILALRYHLSKYFKILIQKMSYLPV